MSVNTCALLEVKVVSADHFSLRFFTLTQACLSGTHRLVAARHGWRVHGLCRTFKTPEKPQFLRRDWEQSAILGIIASRRRSPPSHTALRFSRKQAALSGSWGRLVCCCALQKSASLIASRKLPLVSSRVICWRLARTLIRHKCFQNVLPAGGALRCRETRAKTNTSKAWRRLKTSAAPTPETSHLTLILFKYC